MKSFTSIVGWMLMLAIIAIPAFFFYNWRAGRKAGEAAVTPQTQAPSAASLFAGADKNAAEPSAQPQGRPAAQPPLSPPAPAHPAVQAPAAQASSPGNAAASMPAQQPPSASAEPPQPQAQQKPPALPADESAAPAQAAAPKPAAPAAVSTQPKTASYFAPKTDRDPTMSPEDYQKIRDEEERRLEAERLERLRIANENRMRGPARQISLQGIVGNQVIINGDMYTVGQTVKGARIVKIGSNSVIFEWKDKGEVKQFKKIME